MADLDKSAADKQDKEYFTDTPQKVPEFLWLPPRPQRPGVRAAPMSPRVIGRNMAAIWELNAIRRSTRSMRKTSAL
jgi:hypothetical protein